MTFMSNQLFAQVQNQSATMSQSDAQYAEESAKIREQATMDALWRMAQNNAVAKLKGLAKLAESVNSQN